VRVSTRAVLLVSSAVLTAIAVAAAAQDVRRPSRGSERFALRVVATGLEGPWEIAWGPDEHLWVTERRGGRVLRINPADGSRSVAGSIAGVHQSVSQDGLLGLALHPDLLRGTGNDYVYVAFTYDADTGPAVARRLAIRRYTYDADARTLGAPADLLTGLPAHDDHVAGRLVFGPDRTLYLSIGDQGSNFGQNRCTANRAQELPSAADVSTQDWSKYQGKIIRVNLDGSIPADNPTLSGVQSHVYSYGHRNPLGLAFLGERLYASEHGPSSDDEVNLIEAGKNYGWPNVAGFRDDHSYAYGNWSASRPEPCASLLSVNVDRIPPSVPTRKETEWTHPDFAAPLATFYTVETGYDFAKQGNATIAPGGLDVYRSSAIAGWNNSLLVLSLLRGAVYRVPLAPDSRRTSGAPVEYFKSTNRYRDIAVHPDGRTFYLVTDGQGRSTDASGAISRTLDHPDALLEFTYRP
jgi:PQQ-dependent dehydrogenase (s-GDH family)